MLRSPDHLDAVADVVQTPAVTLWFRRAGDIAPLDSADKQIILAPMICLSAESRGGVLSRSARLLDCDVVPVDSSRIQVLVAVKLHL